MNLVPPFQLAAEARRIARPHLRLAILCLGAAMLGATPAGAQQLQGSVQQNDTAPSTGGDVFNFQSPEFNSQGPGESFVGALDGKIYPVSRYSHPVKGNDQQIRAMQSAANHASALPPPAQPGNNSCGGAQRFNWFSPCNHAALMNLYRQSNSNYDMWKAGKRATPD